GDVDWLWRKWFVPTGRRWSTVRISFCSWRRRATAFGGVVQRNHQEHRPEQRLDQRSGSVTANNGGFRPLDGTSFTARVPKHSRWDVLERNIHPGESGGYLRGHDHNSSLLTYGHGNPYEVVRNRRISRWETDGRQQRPTGRVAHGFQSP